MILLLDLFSLFYRAFFALPPLSTKAGEPTSGLYGLSSLVIKLFREEKPAGAAIATDLPGGTFRHEQYPAYKANRPREAPDGLGPQLRRLPELIAAFGFPVFGARGYEGDDVLATLVRELSATGSDPLVVTGDHDALQLARGRSRVYVVSRGGVKDTIWDEAMVRDKLGIPPERVPEWIALTGDPSDNLPGIHGVGTKLAAQLIGQFGDGAQIAAHAAEAPARVREALQAAAADLPLWTELARLRDDVPLPEGPRWAPLDAAAKARLDALFDELEFRSLRARLAALP